jgi:hypothetical protein
MFGVEAASSGSVDGGERKDDPNVQDWDEKNKTSKKGIKYRFTRLRIPQMVWGCSLKNP